MIPSNQEKAMIEQINKLTDGFEKLSHSLEYNNKITEGIVQQVSALGSDVKDIKRKHEQFKDEMQPWLEAKIGLNLLWRWLVTIPVIIAVLYASKTFLYWLGFHR
jgi:hypothetical protein